MLFEVLQHRLLAVVRLRLRNGELSERGLARQTGLSQPHVHNVVKGARILTPETADLILRSLKISILDLCRREELEIGLAGRAGPPCVPQLGVPLLAGPLGPGRWWPGSQAGDREHLFAESYLEGVSEPAAAALVADPAMHGVIADGSVALLDLAPASRQPSGPPALFAIDAGGECLVRWVRRDGELLFFASACGAVGCLRVVNHPILDLIKARLVTIDSTQARYHDRERATSR